MIHEISRRITEVKEAGNMYYKDACLMIKPKYASAECKLLEHEAREILRSMDAPPGMKRARGMSFWVTRVAPPAAVAATAVVLYSTTI